jgi:MiaB-like tRNA modifying enzyme
MKGLLKEAGFSMVKTHKEADVLLINSCVVKSTTENRLRETCKKFSAAGRPMLVTGCAVDAIPDIIRKLSPMAGLVSSHHTLDIVPAVREVLAGGRAEFLGWRPEPKLCAPRLRDNPKMEIIEISQGCRGSCAFCLTKKARGRLHCYPAAGIISAIEKAVSEGCTEIRLTSQDNADYRDGDVLLPELIRMVCRVPGNFKIRIGMMNPAGCKKIMAGLMEVYNMQKVEKFLHVPVQSGSDKILRAMCRGHDSGCFREIVAAFRGAVPGIFIVTDIIAGFPGETDSDFEDTLRMVGETKPGHVNISMYSDRQGTPASGMKKVRSEKIKERSRRLTVLVKSFSRAPRPPVRLL